MGLDHLQEEQQATVLKIRKRVIEAIGRNMDLYGVTLSTGHLYGLLFFADKPMTLDDMGREMEMSKTSMSTGVRTLLDLKMVNKVWSKGSRKDLYEVEYDWHQTFTDYFAIKWRKAVESNLQILRKSIEELNRLVDDLDEEADAELIHILMEDKHKVLQAEAYYKWLDRLIDTMENEEIYKLVPKEEIKEHS
ncbi:MULTISPECIES: GbsR/MarR family transcriptional regulator [Paenibacillus]|uniref:GbsR/MarR family transcriptional regulator n=1 Tax=Paenibacillus TaxID=44249 RepID=UPI000CFCA5F6|nr:MULTISPECIES: GbsR/MarR family transcriptional regulator [unclassified Paenibacillus]MBD8838812.1 GbsR/MarR family transcriptional regulator [Paenibacillus sp. CFBP 13594]MDQ0722119.1 DNA-binding transcriptional regulator GbsR (MarR family) [Paenibacillus sp. W4I10]MDR6719115.1 DNA-binding transcriptional regulator GbsR (MarR family) [Paenibacillus sp. 2003]PRA08510.1 GbsR/MarR family transcriptional regulator [Paenibacillus sp. MYb63]PRA48444.1 GbsR/MarR family transcriptional regulator [P